MVKISDYLSQHRAALLDPLVSHGLDICLTKLRGVLDTSRKVFLAGNGGSAATAEHFSADLSLSSLRGGPRITSVCLNNNTALNSALANDTKYADSLAYILSNYGNADDLLIVFSASGNSENLLRLVEQATKIDVKVFAFLGFDGGTLGKFENIEKIIIRSNVGEYGLVENCHLFLTHFIIDTLLANYITPNV